MTRVWPEGRRRHAGRTAGLLLGLAAVFAVGCSGTSWHVPKGQSHRFSEARATCRKLTDDDGGAMHDDKFEQCMKRRGFRKERFYDGIGFKL